MTYEEKYKWLLDKLEICEVDYLENDAILVVNNNRYYFQFSGDDPTVDGAVEFVMGRLS